MISKRPHLTNYMSITASEKIAYVCSKSKCINADGTVCWTAANQPVWNAWSDWSQCSTTCGNGLKIRTRACVNNVTGEIVSSLLCHGQETEQANCYIADCPGKQQFSCYYRRTRRGNTLLSWSALYVILHVKFALWNIHVSSCKGYDLRSMLTV